MSWVGSSIGQASDHTTCHLCGGIVAWRQKKLYMWPHMKTCNAFFTVDNFRCHLVLGDDQVVGDGGQLFLGSGVTHLGLKLDTDLNSKNFISPCVTLQTMRFPEKTELK